MKRSSFYLIPIVLSLMTLWGCAEKQDFSQYDDLEITPIVESGILYVESPESFINDSAAGVYYSQTFNFDAFSEEFVSENILDGMLSYEVENTTSKELEITIEFLDATGNILDTETFLIGPGPTSNLRRDIAYGGASGRNINIIRNTSALRVTGRNLGDNISVSSVPDPLVIFRSSAQFRLQLQ